MPHVQKGLQCLILMVWNTTSKEEKVKVFHNQIKYAGYHSFKKDKIFYELKDFLMNLKKNEWSYRWLDNWRNEDTSPFYPSERLNS